MTIRIGACECGAVTYQVVGEEINVYACHCLNCQTRSGSAFSEHSIIALSDFTLDGTTVARARMLNGIEFEEVFCETCLSRIYNRNSFLPDRIFLRAGTLSESQHLEPIAHIWTIRKQSWVILPEDVPSFAGSPTPEEFGGVVDAARRTRVR